MGRVPLRKHQRVMGRWLILERAHLALKTPGRSTHEFQGKPSQRAQKTNGVVGLMAPSSMSADDHGGYLVPGPPMLIQVMGGKWKLVK